MTWGPAERKAARVLREGVMRAFREGRKVYSPRLLPCTWEPRTQRDTYPIMQSNGVRCQFHGCSFEPPKSEDQAAVVPPPRPTATGRTFKIPARPGRAWDNETIDTVMLCALHADGKEWLPVTVTVNGVGELEIFSVPRSEET